MDPVIAFVYAMFRLDPIRSNMNSVLSLAAENVASVPWVAVLGSIRIRASDPMAEHEQFMVGIIYSLGSLHNIFTRMVLTLSL